MMTKRKIINDPVYDGFLSVEDPVILQVIEHPYFQRQRRIKQLGLTYLVYPGAMHTRFSHMLGALNLMKRALETLKQKGVEISDEECRGAKLAILLHDIGHGPFSHTSERVLVDVPHEEITLLMMRRINEEMGERDRSGANEASRPLDTAIAIFSNTYHKHFLHQLVSSQLDMDRLDYLGRDSFFTGVSEGIVGTDRIISMLNVHDDELVVDEKGIYSVEKFIISRRLMYWQVYMHKTVIAADQLLLSILRRARELNLSPFTFSLSPLDLDRFAEVDDDDKTESLEVAEAIVKCRSIKPQEYDVPEDGRTEWGYGEFTSDWWSDMCQRVSDEFDVEVDQAAQKYLTAAPSESTVFKMRITARLMDMSYTAECECYVKDKQVRYVSWKE